MRISLEWLAEYLEIPESPEKLKEDLTMLGLVVESISHHEGSPILEIEVTSNRPDCLSHLGIARELSVLYSRPLSKPPAAGRLRISAEQIRYKITIKDPDLCPRYTGLVLDDVHVAPSPLWMQRRLEAAGMRPLNNIVDITNYVLLEMGHPLHAFDFHRLRGGKIVVSRAKPGQQMMTLDGVERELDDQMLLINDGAGPVAIAGVMGGLESEINDGTRAVLLECAYFNPASIRRTSKRLGLSTEASYRFERGADWDDTVAATARTCYLIQELAGGQIAGSLQDLYPKKIKHVKIELRRSRAEALLGTELPDGFIVSVLERLEFRPFRKGKGHWLVTCPSYRSDMQMEADLIEELARFYGYQNIPTTLPPGKTSGIVSPVYPFESAARRLLLGLGYSEAVNLSFAGESEQIRFPTAEVERAAISNPLTEDTQFLRTTLVDGLVKAVKRNLNHGVRIVRFFEIGKIYLKGEQGHPRERLMLGIAGTGGFAGQNWRNPEAEYDFFHLKGVITTLLRGMRSAPFEVVPSCGASWLNPANCASLQIRDKEIGVLGALHPDIAEEQKLKQPVYLAQLYFEELSRNVFLPVQYETLAKFPSAERDLSIVLSRDVSYGAIRRGILGLGISELVSLELIDVYEGENIPADKISLTIRMTFQDRNKTLTVDQVQALSDNVITFLRSSYGAQLR